MHQGLFCSKLEYAFGIKKYKYKCTDKVKCTKSLTFHNQGRMQDFGKGGSNLLDLRAKGAERFQLWSYKGSSCGPIKVPAVVL